MERLRVCVYYDFASTLCYVAHRVMQRMDAELAELALELVWTPIDLVRLTRWPRGGEIRGAPRANAQRVADELGVAVRIPRTWPDSRAANRAAIALAGTPHEPAWRERVFSALHEEGRVLDADGTFEALAADLRLAPGDLAAPETEETLAETTQAARHAEVTGVPTFMLGPWPFGGIQEEASMRSILTRWAAKQRSPGKRPQPRAARRSRA